SASVARGRQIDPLFPTQGGEEFHPPPAVSIPRPSARIWSKSVSNAGKSVRAGLSEPFGEVPQSTAKRGWINRWCPTHNRRDRAGPDAAGATRKKRGRPRCGVGHSNLLRLSSETS